MSKKLIIISAGGTGGHLFPAQALAQQLLSEESFSDVVFIAGGLKKSKYFDRSHFTFEEVACGPLFSKKPLTCLKGWLEIVRGIIQSVNLLKQYRPNLVVGFGSYYTVPTVLAARWLNIPILLHEANSVPGKANRWLASMATCVGINFPAARNHFKVKSEEVGLPLREGYRFGDITRKEAHDYFGLDPYKKTLMVFGGSQGAHGINRKVKECFPLLSEMALQIVHFTGNQDVVDDLNRGYALYNIPSCVKVFEEKMSMGWAAADAFIGRSGASTIAEAIEFEVPGILIPYPFATDQHQDKNADYFVGDVGGGWKMLEKDLTDESLSNLLTILFEQLDRSKIAIQNYKKNRPQQTLLQLVMQLIN